MSKVTKKQLEHQIDLLSAENSKQHEYLMRIKRALKSIDIDILSDAFDKPKPQLKALDQSVFDGLDEKWRFAMVSSVGIPFVYDYKPTGKMHFLSDSSAQLMVNLGKVMRIDEYDYDTTDWQNSLIERNKVELTGSDLCRAMLARGDKCVMCYLSHTSEESAKDVKGIVIGSDRSGFRVLRNNSWQYAIPINNQGEPLTASEVGL